MKKKLKINFTDFWNGFDKESNLFINLLREHFEVEISETPDVIIYSCFGFEYMKFRCFRIFYTPENVRPNFKECDFSFTFDYNTYNNKNFRLPLYRWRGDLEDLRKQKDPEKILAEKKKFCCMVVSNAKGKERNLFFEKLSKYKKVDSGGSYQNNIGYKVPDKMKFINDYKFSISFENASFPGYTTEKLVESLLVNNLAVYWGNTSVKDDFNTKSFINVHDYNTFDEVIERIIEIDKKPEIAIEYFQQPYFTNNQMPSSLEYLVIAEKLKSVIESFNGIAPVVEKVGKTYSYGNKVRRQFLARVYKKPHWDF